MPQTLVTGANGFLSAHLIDQLFALGHQVVGSLRSSAQGDAILATHPEWAHNLSFVIVEDYAKEGAWDEVFKVHGFDFVVHSAAPLLDDPRNTDFERDYLRPNVQGNEQLLKSAKKYGKNIKSIAVTGTVNAITDGSDISTRVLSSSEWLPLTIDDAIKLQHPYISYCVSKAEGEKAIWKFVEEEKPTFTVEVILCALIFGPPIQPVKGVGKMNFSTDQFYGLWNGKNVFVPETPFGSYIDVRDLAKAHINALTVPEAANQRLLVGGKWYSHQLAIDTLKGLEEFKGLESRFVKQKEWPEKRPVFGDVEEGNQKLGLALRSEEETFGDTARKILELEKLFA